MDEQLDFIGKFENLAEDCQKLKSILGVKVEMKVHTERNTRNEYQKYFNSNTREIVRELYAKDIENFAYKY